MSSLTSVIGIVKVLVKDKKKDQKMAIPLDCRTEDLVQRLDYCMDPFEFEQWHLRQIDWIHRNTQNEGLERLCMAVALALRSAIMKADTLRYHTRCKTPFPTPFHSARHMVVSALGDILNAFKAFRAVNKEPDLDAVHIRAMVRVYLIETFHLMFLFGKLESSRRRFFFRLWESSLNESKFEDFRFDDEFEYAQRDRPQMENTNLSGSMPDPAQFPGTCLPHHPSRQVLVLNRGPYGPATVLNL